VDELLPEADSLPFREAALRGVRAGQTHASGAAGGTQAHNLLIWNLPTIGYMQARIRLNETKNADRGVQAVIVVDHVSVAQAGDILGLGVSLGQGEKAEEAIAGCAGLSEA
jgi:hypothetical protein